MTNENALYSKGNPMIYGDLTNKEIQKRVDIYVCLADSLCGPMETNTTL